MSGKLADLITVAALALCVSAVVACVLSLVESPSRITEVAGGLVWAVVFAVLFSYGLYLRWSNKVWQALVYGEDLSEEIVREARRILEEMCAEYEVVSGAFGLENRIVVRAPFKATITVGKWGHVSYKVRGVPVSTGTVIVVKPYPSKASENLKEFMWKLLFNVGLVDRAYEWK